MSPFLENPETEHEDRSVLLVILCTYLNHLGVFFNVSQNKKSFFCFFLSLVAPSQHVKNEHTDDSVHVPNTHTHTLHVLLTQSTAAAVFHLNEFLNLFVSLSLPRGERWRAKASAAKAIDVSGGREDKTQ